MNLARCSFNSWTPERKTRLFFKHLSDRIVLMIRIAEVFHLQNFNKIDKSRLTFPQQVFKNECKPYA